MVETNIANSQPVSDEYLEKMNAYWRAANYLGAAQLYLLDNGACKEEDRRSLGNSSGTELRVCSFKSCNQEI